MLFSKDDSSTVHVPETFRDTISIFQLISGIFDVLQNYAFSHE